MDPSILIHHGKQPDNITIISVYVDDFLLASKYRASMDWIKDKLKAEDNVKDLEEVKTIIGWQITRHEGTLKTDQSAFIRNLLEEKDLTGCNSVNIPMKAGSVIDMSKADDYKEADIKVYQRLIEKLMYLSCGTRPDIAFVVGQLSKRNADPRVSHLRAAKRVMRYLKGAMQIRLTYGTGNVQSTYGLVGYVDSKYAGDPKDRKSVMRQCFFINRAIVS